MYGPQVTINLDIIERNARFVVEACAGRGIHVFGVTKGTCGMPAVARAMLRGGVVGIGESRFENIHRLRASGIDCPILLLRSAPLARIEELVREVDISLNSELAAIGEISRVAERMGRVHDIILMVDLGDLREGIWPSDLEATVQRVLAMKGVRIVGLGTNLSCFGAIMPTAENLGRLAAHARMLEEAFGLELHHVSGGNSTSLPLVLSGDMPRGINNLRLGESILQGGRDTFGGSPPAGLDSGAFELSGEVLELKVKPSVPIGRVGVDAFGRRPSFRDRGERLRGIVNIGREDAVVEGLAPVRPGVEILGASSDHMVVDLTDAQPAATVGERLAFRMDYGALLAVMTSEYVEKMPTFEPVDETRARRVRILPAPALAPLVEGLALPGRLGALGLEVQSVSSVHDAGAYADDAMRQAVAGALEDGAVPLVFGGDHRASAATLRALAGHHQAFGLLWFDAVPALVPPGDGRRHPGVGALHDVLAAAPGADGVRPALAPENVVLIGLRNVHPAEAALIRKLAIPVFTIADVDALGIREVMRQAVRLASAGTRGLFVSYSPNVTDIPGTVQGTGGITLRETHQAMEAVAQTATLLGMDVVDLDPAGEARILEECTNFVMSCFGKRIL